MPLAFKPARPAVIAPARPSPVQRRARCCDVVVHWEGGYVDHPKDPGGPTKYGITLRALSDHRGHPCTAADVHALSEVEADAIYGEVYWPAVRGAELPAGVDLMVFDAGVNTGRGRAVQALQRALGVEDDGAFGGGTLRALQASGDLPGLVRRISVERERYYRGLRGFPTFGRGWLNRLAGVTAQARTWVVGG